MRGRALALGALSLALAGCGGAARPTQPPARALAGTIVRSGTLPRVRPSDYRAPLAGYRRHVRRELGLMRAQLRRLAAAIAAGDRDGARAAWLAADARYESIGAAYGAFGQLDRSIDGRPAGLTGGVRSRRFRGLHRVERILWTGAPLRSAAAPVRRLDRDVARLRGRVRGLQIDPLDYSLRAHEVMEDALHLGLSGRASPWSGSALVALRANLRGTRTVLGTLRGLITRRNPTAWRTATASLDELERTLRAVGRPDGSLPRWDRLGLRQRERVAGRTAAAAEALAAIPELIDPRPQRAAQPVLADGTP